MLSIYFGIISIFLCLLHNVFSANILCLLPVPSPSHHIWNKVIINELANKGHNVTILSCDADKNPAPNITYLHMWEVYQAIYGDGTFSLIDLVNETSIHTVKGYYDFQYLVCDGIFKSKAFAQLLNYPNGFKFDLILFDFTMGPCQLGFLDKFNYPPLIAVSPFNNPSFSHHVIGGHKYYAYIPHYGLSYGTEMNFWQRGFNAFIHGFDEIYRAKFVNPNVDKKMRIAYNNPNLPYAGDLEKMTQIMLVNSNPVIDHPHSIPPNLIQVGGLQIQPPKLLPADLEEFVTKSKNGFVLFSLGTNVRSDSLSVQNQQMFIDAMSNFPDYNFLWKFETDFKLVLPKNVIIRKWLPQTDLLGHSKIKAFITHCGLLSMHESIWYGVPMVAVPIYLDQKRNSHRIVEMGLGEKISIRDADKRTIVDALKQVLENPKYTQKIKQLSTLFKDSPSKPLDTAIWWIDYVLRNSNLSHLRSPTHKLGFIRSNLYDIIGAGMLLLVAVYYLFCKILERFKRSPDEFKLKKN